MLTSDLLISLSRLWVLAGYECVRLSFDKITAAAPGLAELLHRFTLVRIPLAKQEIAKDRALGQNAILLGRRGEPQETPPHAYRAGAKIPYWPEFVINLETGSVGWTVIDIVNGGTEVTILRRELSDELLKLMDKAA